MGFCYRRSYSYLGKNINYHLSFMILSLFHYAIVLVAFIDRFTDPCRVYNLQLFLWKFLLRYSVFQHYIINRLINPLSINQIVNSCVFLFVSYVITDFSANGKVFPIN